MSKLRQETMHTATISTADKGNHAPLSCGAEDESQVNPVIPGVRTQAVMSRFAGLVTVPTTIEPKAQYRQADCAGGCATSPRLLLSHRKLRTKLRTLSG